MPIWCPGSSSGERISSVLSCKRTVCFWFGNCPEPFKWLLSWPCQLQGENLPVIINIHRSHSEIYLIGKVVSRPVPPGSTSENSVDLPKRNSIFSQCFPRKSKAPHPQEIWKNLWLGFGWRLCSWHLLCCHILGNVRRWRRKVCLY